MTEREAAEQRLAVAFYGALMRARNGTKETLEECARLACDAVAAAVLEERRILMVAFRDKWERRYHAGILHSIDVPADAPWHAVAPEKDRGPSSSAHPRA